MNLAMCLVSRSLEIDLREEFQETYIKKEKMLERYQMRNSKPIETSVEKNVGLSLDMFPKNPEERERRCQEFPIPAQSEA